MKSGIETYCQRYMSLLVSIIMTLFMPLKTNKFEWNNLESRSICLMIHTKSSILLLAMMHEHSHANLHVRIYIVVMITTPRLLFRLATTVRPETPLVVV
jgi:hypothetical protein